MTKRLIVLLAILVGLALSACGAIGSDTTFPSSYVTNGITSFRLVTADEAGLTGATKGQVLELSDASVERAVVTGGSLFYAWAPALTPAPMRDPTLPIRDVDYAQFGPRRIARSASTNGLSFAPGPDVLDATLAWEGAAVFDPFVFVLPSGVARLYYAAQDGIGVAEAPSIDGTFAKVGTAPILGAIAGAGVPRSPSVVTSATGYLLFVEAAGHVYAAESTDGLAFTLVDADTATPTIDPLALPAPVVASQDAGVADGGADAGVPVTEVALERPCATRALTAEGRDHLRLYFGIRYSDATTKVGVAASYGDLPLDRSQVPTISKNAPSSPTPDVRGQVTVLYGTTTTSLANGAAAGTLVGYVSPTDAALPVASGPP